MSDQLPSSTPASQVPDIGRTILVVDDDRLVLLNLTSALVHAGYRVVEADNGDDAILLAREHRPDLAILDIRMDGKSGLDVAAYLRDFLDQPFIFLSAYSDAEEVARGMSYGALAYLAKPIDGATLIEEIERALQRAGERAASLRWRDEALRQAQPTVQQWLACGVLMERHACDLTEALRLLSEAAARDTDSLHQAALKIMAGTRRDARGAGGAGGCESATDPARSAVEPAQSPQLPGAS